MARATILQRLLQLKYPCNDNNVALRLSITVDYASNIMRRARDMKLVTLEAFGLYWPTELLKSKWKRQEKINNGS